MTISILVPLVMFGWIPVVLILCALLPTRRAVIASFVIAWMFLPEYQYHIQGLPAYSKMSATCGGVLLAALFFDISKLLSFRPSWIDLPMVVWCLCPGASSLSNGLGLYDGVSAAFAQTVTVGNALLHRAAVFQRRCGVEGTGDRDFHWRAGVRTLVPLRNSHEPAVALHGLWLLSA